jgi:hypothetical protein
MAHVVGQALWLSVPVALTGILHMVVVMKRWLPRLAKPIDGGATLGGRPIFGDNKTWRGVVVMVFGSALIGGLQGLLGGAWAERSGVALLDFALIGALADDGPTAMVASPHGADAYVVGYATVNAALGFGYALGELPNSFLKRRLAITPGKMGAGLVGGFFFLLDQADSVLAALALGALAFGISWKIVAVGTVCLTLLHLAINVSLYLAKVRKNL